MKKSREKQKDKRIRKRKFFFFKRNISFGVTNIFFEFAFVSGGDVLITYFQVRSKISIETSRDTFEQESMSKIWKTTKTHSNDLVCRGAQKTRVLPSLHRLVCFTCRSLSPLLAVFALFLLDFSRPPSNHPFFSVLYSTLECALSPFVHASLNERHVSTYVRRHYYTFTRVTAECTETRTESRP